MTEPRNRICTTHVGSLPRPDALRTMMVAEIRNEPIDAVAFSRECAAAVKDAVTKQIDCGIDVISDGEMSKISYVGYVKNRLRGLTDSSALGPEAMSAVLPGTTTFPDLTEHPDYAEHRARQATIAVGPVCTGAVSYGNPQPLQADLERLAEAAAGIDPARTFVNAASPGVLAMFIPNSHYPSEEAYLAALTQAMKYEYDRIAGTGRLLQIDCPDLAMSWHMRHWQKGEKEFRKIARRNVEAINAALSDIPPDRVRIHICWGNYAGPHTHDIPVAVLFDVLFHARARYISFEGANPRHAHEWEDWRIARIPDDKVLLPGVIDSTTNIVEHPRLVAQRIRQYADIVGRDRVIASTDCGFGTFALRQHNVFPSVVWSKFRALCEGARMASAALWN